MIKKQDVDQILKLFKDNEYEFETPNPMDEWMQYGLIRKDIKDGEVLKIIQFRNADRKKELFYVLCENYLEIPLSIKKERKFFELNNIKFNSLDDYLDFLESESVKDWFKENQISLVVSNNNGMIMGSLIKSYVLNKQVEFFNQIKDSNKIYKAKIIDKNHGGFIANIDGVNIFLPGSLASANKIINFDNFIGKTIDVMIEDYLKEDQTFIASNKKYINYILENKIKDLQIGEQYSGNVTGTSKFGIFIEWNTIFTGLLHISEMTQELKDKFYANYFKPGSKINFYIKEITKDNKIILTGFKDIIEKYTIEQFKQNYEKSILEGEIFNITEYGTFVKFIINNNSFIGLLYYKDYINDFMPQINDKISLFIDYIDCESNKIYLKIPKNAKQ